MFTWLLTLRSVGLVEIHTRLPRHPRNKKKINSFKIIISFLINYYLAGGLTFFLFLNYYLFFLIYYLEIRTTLTCVIHLI